MLYQLSYRRACFSCLPLTAYCSCSHRESNPGRLVEGQGSLPLDDDCVISMNCAMQPAGFEPASSE